MEAFPEVTPLWDLSQHVDLNQLPDNDFLALLQKQFPTDSDALSYMGPFTEGVNPQNLSSYPLPSLTPPSEDSSPSPPNSNQDNMNDDGNDSMLKRKASDDDLSDEPTQKSQHTNGQQSEKRANTGGARRKSGGTGTGKDEGRLLKRKEQNRAAQRAFRERKEKHVKDLEDKVADLEAKNEQALNENENLRDLLTRLQSENVTLKQNAAVKQSAFTFSVPKSTPSNVESPTAPQNPVFSVSPPPVASSSASASTSPKMSNPLDWSSLTTFDPTMLNLLDDSVPQPTATEGAMQMDFGFGANTGLASNAPYTTIASNPMFMSFASTFDSYIPEASGSTPSGSGSSNFVHNGNMNNNMNFNFDMNSLSTWPAPSANQDNILDDLFAGYLTSNGVLDNSILTSSPASISPVAHHISPARSPLNHASSSSSSSSLSPPMSGSLQSNMTPRDSPLSDSEMVIHRGSEFIHNNSECPKTKSELEQRIVNEGSSPFAPPAPINVRKSSDAVLGTMIACAGSSFPKTAKSDKNIEVLSAWRTIRSDPKFKDADINELCSEFTSKARCDGTKVVLEPQGVNSILESLSKKQ